MEDGTASEGPSDDESNYDVDEKMSQAEIAETKAALQRKKAGLPELEVDALPSTIMPRVMQLVCSL